MKTLVNCGANRFRLSGVGVAQVGPSASHCCQPVHGAIVVGIHWESHGLRSSHVRHTRLRLARSEMHPRAVPLISRKQLHPA